MRWGNVLSKGNRLPADRQLKAVTFEVETRRSVFDFTQTVRLVGKLRLQDLSDSTRGQNQPAFGFSREKSDKRDSDLFRTVFDRSLEIASPSRVVRPELAEVSRKATSIFRSYFSIVTEQLVAR